MRIAALRVFGLIGALFYLGMAGDRVTAAAGHWGVLFAIDAPWRLEPILEQTSVNQKTPRYGAIPISIMFRQAINEKGRQFGSVVRLGTGAGDEITVGKIDSIQVQEIQSITANVRTNFGPGDLRDIESKRLISSKNNEPAHEFCKQDGGASCGDVYITDTDAWHALLWYQPRLAVDPGRNISLIITVRTITAGGTRRNWRSSVVVHAGEAPLPRFADNWLYGDLHYHSQMTANEGEYGYSYRNVGRVLGALGLDFVFATDHASNGVQTLSKVETVRCGDINGPICRPTPIAGGSLLPDIAIPGSNGTQFVRTRETCRTSDGKKANCLYYVDTAARDLNVHRFGAAKANLYGGSGVSARVLDDAGFGYGRLRNANIVPQVYMGEEVDAQVEISAAEFDAGFMRYGDGLRYEWTNISDCRKAFDIDFCKKRYSFPASATDHRTLILADDQGLLAKIAKAIRPGVLAQIDPFPSRQHIVYFPVDSGPSSAGFVASDTGPFGGAGKRLDRVVGEMNDQGFAFLAHPLLGGAPGGVAGPDIAPYSDSALNVAWASPVVLGLQFWNESFTHEAPVSVDDSSLAVPMVELQRPFNGAEASDLPPWRWQASALKTAKLHLYDAAFTWDRYLRKGLRPDETRVLPWLPAGEARKWFVGAGSDAHGDWNYRQHGELCEARWCTSGISDTAIGRPRNMVEVTTSPSPVVIADAPKATRYANTQVIAALRAGRFTATDGPALRIAVDKNRNGRIDPDDYAMGSTFELNPGEQIPVIIEWLSTPEFGPLQRIDLYVGNKDKTFAPANHGPYIPALAEESANPALLNPAYGLYFREFGNYAPDPTAGVLQVDLRAATLARRQRGSALFFLSPQQFGLSGTNPDLFYVRAFARTRFAGEANFVSDCQDPNIAGQSCGNRIAYSNPVWGKIRPTCAVLSRSPPGLGGRGRPTSNGLDGDGNGVADTCERDIPNACNTPQTVTGPGGVVIGQLVTVLDISPRSSARSTIPKAAPGNSCQIAGKSGSFDRGDVTGPIGPVFQPL